MNGLILRLGDGPQGVILAVRAVEPGIFGAYSRIIAQVVYKNGISVFNPVEAGGAVAVQVLPGVGKAALANV